MRWEAPEFKRCCFCLPLRRSLVGWGYLRLVVDILALINISSSVYSHVFYNRTILSILLVLLWLYYVIDSVFALILIIGGHKKNYTLVRAAKIYGIVWLIPVLFFGGFLVYLDIICLLGIVDNKKYSLLRLTLETCFIAVIIFLQVYVILLMNSQGNKLQKEELEMQFRNNAADGEALCARLDNGLDAHLSTDDAQIVH